MTSAFPARRPADLRLRFHVGSKSVAVRTLRSTVQSLLRDRGHPESWVAAVVLGLDEVVMNSIQHGSCLGGDVEVELQLSAGELVIEVSDRGGGTNGQPCNSDDAGLPVDEAECGRGLFLTQQAMDEVSYHERKGGGTRVRLLKRV